MGQPDKALQTDASCRASLPLWPVRIGEAIEPWLL